MKRRILSIITALALCLSLCPTWALAAEADPSLCKHHPEHTEDCGYAAPTEGHPCGHQHTAECYTLGVLPDGDSGDPYEVGGDTENLLDCHHSHDSACGYIAPTDGAPCGYECRICPIEDLIAALPEQVTEDNAADVRGQLDHILDLYRELNEDEQEEINLTRIYALQGALDNANAPIQAAEEINISQNLNNILTADEGDCPGHTFTGTTANVARIYVGNGVHNVTFSGLNISTANVGIAPGATMNLTIEGTNEIKSNSYAGIYVPENAALVITAESTGTLDVSSSADAGIGGGTYDSSDPTGSTFGDPNCGTVVINGGIINATGGSGCAGIGGGLDAAGNPGNGGTVTINAGTVTATGGSDSSGNYGGAGIGGAGGGSNEWYDLVSGSGGTLTINGGHVTLAPGAHNTQWGTAYGFGRGSGDASDGTCELTLADASYLDSGTTLDPNGKYTINGDPTEDMIVVPTDLVYNGQAQELNGRIYIDDSKTGTGTYFNQPFTVKASAEDWILEDLGDVVNAGTYTATFTKGDKSISKTFTVAQSGTQFVGDGEVKTYNGDALTTTFTASDTIKVVAAPTPTGAAPKKAAARLRADPTAGQMAVFVGTTQVSEPVSAGDGGTYTMTARASDVLLAAGGPGTEIPLTAKFVGNDNMADGAGTVDVKISAVAMAEKGGAVIGYYGESNLDSAFTNEGATITLLDNITTSTHIEVKTENLTLDLNGKTITKPTSYAFLLLGSSHLTIRGNGKVICTGTSGFYPEAITLRGGALTLEDGTFIGLVNDVLVDGETSVLSVTGESVSIQGEGRGLRVGSAQSVQLSAGTYSNISVSDISVGSSHTLASLLAENCAYYRDSTPILLSELEGKTELIGPVTVGTCEHMGGLTANDNGYQHGGPCRWCGATLAATNHTLDAATNTCPVCKTELVAEVKPDGSPTNLYYTDLDGILKVFNSTVKLLRDINASQTITGAGASLTWDLNGKTFTNESGTAVNVEYPLTVGGGNVSAGGCCFNVDKSSTLSIASGSYSGGEAAIKVTSGGLKLTGGSFTGNQNAIIYTSGEVKNALANYGQENGPHYAFYKDGTSLYKPEGSSLPAGTFTVKECEHDGVTPTSNNDGTHALKCPYCGYSEAAANCTYVFSGTTGTCAACKDSVTVAVSGAENLIYDGTEKKPGVTVMRADTELTVGTDYTVAYSDNKNAGENKATVTVTIGNGQGSYTEKFTIDRATPTITWSNTTQELTYTGQQAAITAPTVTLVNNESFGGTIHYSYTGTTSGTGLPTNAGTYTIMASITAEGNYTNAQTATPLTLTINKAQAVVTGEPTANTLTYTGAAQALVTAGTASVGEVVYSLTEAGTYSSTIPTGTDAGSYTVWYKVEDTTNYEGTDPVKVDVTIGKATASAPQTGTLNVQNGQNRDYTYNLSRLLPVLTSGQSFGGDVTYTLKSVNITEAGYYDSGKAAISGATLTLPIKAVTSSIEGQIGTITVTISSKNFADVDATINVNRVNKQPVSIEGVTAQNGTYNGKSHSGYTGTPTASPYSGGFTVTYAKADGTALSGAPTNAGDYTVTITLNENNDYTGSRTLSFTISKASITIKADDKRADVGAAKPALTYTVTGLVSGDTLATAPTLACDADMNTIGQYPITASGAAVPSGGNYNTAITYVAGTLSVTDPTIPVTGVTLNKTSTTLTVGGSERLTATVAPSEATDKSVTWASSNTAVATVDANGTVTAVSAGTATITVTTADGAKTATCSVTVRSNSGGGSSYVPSTPSNPSTSTITVPVSGDKDTVRVSASVSGTTATVSKIDTSQIENVIGDNGQASMVEIDFTGLGKTIDTVKLPAAAIKDIAAKAQNEEVRGLTVKLPEAEISFDANALSAIQAQAGSQITLTVTPAKPADLNSRQKEAVGSAPVFDLTLRSSSGAITDFRGGYATVSLPYTLAAGQNPSGVVVYYLDSTGNITPCTTMYDVRSKSAIFTTGHFSLYFVGYDPAAVWVNPFSDVAGDAWYYDAVRYASENGLMGGYGNGKFGPNDNLSRAQFAQILFNKEGRPVVNYLLRYNDVADGAWYTEAVRWATSQGVVSGYGNGMFGPNDNITREQLAVMLWRYAGSPAATEKELHFTDTDKASGFALEALRWAVENGVMGGYGDGRLDPKGLATRAQVAQMLKNYLEK